MAALAASDPLASFTRVVNGRVEVLANGAIKTADGRSHKSPSGAARSQVGRPVDGWTVWRTSDGTPLGELRTKLTLKID